MRTIDSIITKVNTSRGEPMGRCNEGRIYDQMGKKIYDCKVPLDSGGYDKGGAYWGHGAELRVMYTKDLQYIHFYRQTY